MHAVVAPLVAHSAGLGWDEAALVMAPITLVGAFLFLANSRAKKLGSQAPSDQTSLRDTTSSEDGWGGAPSGEPKYPPTEH